jgi:hypothetical protein
MLSINLSLARWSAIAPVYDKLFLTSTRPKIHRMVMSNLTFGQLRRIRLDSHYCQYEIQRPHLIAVARTQAAEPVATLARSLYFIAEHCPLLLSLHINPRSVSYKHNELNLSTLTAITSALKCLVKHRPNLEVIGVRVYVKSVLISTSGDFIRDSHSFYDNQDVNLELDKIPVHAREDILETWCNTSFREALVYDEIVKFVSQEAIEAGGVGLGGSTDGRGSIGFDGWEDRAMSDPLMSA